MTLENLMSQMGMGTKQLTDRYSGEYTAPAVHDQQIYYAYEPPSHSHGQTASPKHHHYSGSSGLKTNASMSALTLLAFLFFLHILQQCIKEHMTEMSTAPLVVMSASRESNDDFKKSTAKIDKTGITESEEKIGKTENYVAENPFKKNTDNDNDKMMRIHAPEHKPSGAGKVYGYVYKPQVGNNNNEVNKNEESSFPGFVSAMNDD